MPTRLVLRPPVGEPMMRDVVDGRWDEPSGDPSSIIGVDEWALPGLADAHAHLAVAELDYGPGDLEGAMERARLALSAGVTLVLDKGWRDDTAVRVTELVAEGERPDIEAAATVIASEGGYFPGFAREVTPEALARAVASAAAEAKGWVKLIGDWPRKGVGPQPNFDEAGLRLAVTVAESHGAKVAIHSMARDVPTMAVRAGVHSIEHGLFLTESDISELGARAGMWVPTFLRVEAVIRQLGEGSSGGRLLSEGLANASRMLRPAVEAGVLVLAGTDLIGSPANVADEALRLGEYGLSPAQVVEAVSISARIATGRPSAFDLGAPADVVLFPANPVFEPTVLARPSLVMRHGRIL